MLVYKIMAKIHFEKFIQKDIDTIRTQVSLTDLQEQMLAHLLKGRFNDEGIALEMNLSRATYYRTKKILCDKIRTIPSFF